ncbi:autophagy protein 5 [Orbilia brochopaga]|uniref:Autophagy protein 5 n=1 Tax=Orbilia brochopaga TaxID=3140254 RepID=A0AAV9U1X1_9PEZI
MSDALRRAVWDGSIPVRVLLDPSECRIFDQADAYYLQAHRVAYLPFYLPRIYRFFEPFLIDKSVATVESAWFEVDNAPLRWHWPIGLLHDFYTALDPTKTASTTTPPTNHDRSASPPPPADPEPGVPQLPWTITLRFASYPHDLLTTLTPTSTHDSFINTIKEADFARNGTAKAVMSLSPTDSRRLFASLQDHDFDGFWGVCDKMLNHSGSSVRNVPLRVYNPETGQVIQGSMPVRQAASLRGGDPQTLGGALNSLVPMLFPSRRSVVLARPVMHGVVLPLSVPLVDLMREAMYPDGFLHITLAMMDDDNDNASSYMRLTRGEEDFMVDAHPPLDLLLDGDADWVVL